MKPLEEIIDPGWAQALAPVEPEIRAMGDFLRAQPAYLPAGADVLRAFTYPFDAAEVLIVGQDPYPTPGHPIGLSFAVAPDVRPLPGSLLNIYKELVSDLGVAMPSNGDLRPWAQRGVVLLNRVLSVAPGRSASHRGKGWEPITERAIVALASRGTPLVAILWGRDAQTLTPMLREHDVPVLTSAHPSPLSAHRGFFGSRPFSRANAALVAQGGTPIDWSLP
ncbi:MAG: uracil-DNA glycosylase [Candidatus Nanopelagicales bacterium]|jgi:uracil-DNA glycosylase|nr:uracil-DNA glycosylase [Candidatus Nanopelagicales bacterium]MCU0294873.1 uracil-DNA glycosylase [Candidatus Nanopelagicales bacterium]MCU0298347.1 uracil-DNA glycosylase [Candidatus Nanopelagicales bacterium]